MVTFKQLEKVLTAKAFKDLNKWISGQTISMNDKREAIIYDDDLLRWLEGREVID